jgi:hypothetical protein
VNIIIEPIRLGKADLWSFCRKDNKGEGSRIWVYSFDEIYISIMMKI